jgi:hypothetical protein
MRRSAAASRLRSFQLATQTVTNQVDNARLQRRRRADGGQRVAHPFQPVRDGDEMSWQPRVFRSVNPFIQNVAPSVCLIQIPRISRLPSGSTASAR